MSLINKILGQSTFAALVITLSTTAYALEFRVDGFASVVVGKAVHQVKRTDGSDTTYLANTPQGIYDGDWDLTPDSIIGLQLLTRFNDTFSITAQATAEGQNDFDLALEWAYLTYHLTPNTQILVGRQRLPLFYFSDFLEVGYAYHFVRPPQEVYDLPFDDFEGIQLEHRFTLNDWDGQIQVYAGNTKDTLTEPINQGQLNDIVGGVFSIGNHWLEFRAIYGHGDLSSNNISRQGVLQDTDNAIDTYFAGFAASVNLDDVMLLTEVVQIGFDDPLGPDQGLGGVKLTGWYVSAAYQWDTLTPYVVYAENTFDIDQESFFLTLANVKNQDLSSSAWTVGLRWDFMQQVALKTEYTKRHDHSSGGLQRILGKDREIDLLTLGFHAIF